MTRKLNLMRTDRIGYVVGGLALIAWAGRRPSWPKAAAAGFGAWLLYQAYTGSNPMFKPLGLQVNRQPALGDMSETMVVEEAITISRPRNEGYGYFAQPAHLPALADATLDVIRANADDELAWRARRAAKPVALRSLGLSR